MNVALVTDWFHPRVGGIEVHVLGLARGLQARGIEVTVVTPWPGPDRVAGVSVHRLDLPLVPGLGVSLSPFRLARAMEDALRAGSYDLVHTHVSVGSTTAIAAGFAGPRTDTPVLATFHSTFQLLGWVYVLAGPILRWRSWPFRATAVSEAVAQDLAWIMPERQVTLLPNAIDQEAWRLPPDTAESDRGRLRLVTTSRLQRRKRVGALLRILRQVRSRVAGRAEVTLEILGDGPRRSGLQRLAGRLGLQETVRFLGKGGPEEVRAMLARGDVFVNACDRESFGIAALEALACGLPVVARREGGVGAFVEDGGNGLLVGSDAAMAAALADLARDGSRLRSLQKGAARGIPERYTWSHQVERHLELYREMVAGTAVAG